MTPAAALSRAFHERTDWLLCDDAIASILALLDEDGFVITPKEPTTAMLAAGQLAWLRDPTRRSSTLFRAMAAVNSPTREPAHD